MSERTSKTCIADLAACGGPPLFAEPVHSCRPYVPDRTSFFGYLEGALARRVLTNHGPLVRQLEGSLAQILGVDHCVATCNGTAGMAILIRALGLSGEVIMPAFTFVSTAHVLVEAGITPVFSDINEFTWMIDAADCEKLITEKTSAIIATHLWGRPCDVAALEALCGRYDLKLIFDAAHAFGSTYQQIPISGNGDAEVFSFHATKIYHTGEGGAITTNNRQLAEDLQLRRNFGFSDYDQIALVGTNAKMSELSAAMGLAGLEQIENRRQRTLEVFSIYESALSEVQGLLFFRQNSSEKHHYHYIVCRVLPGFGLDRDQFLQLLQAENILARRYFYPGLHRMNIFPASTLGPSHSCSVADIIGKEVLVLPGGADIRNDEIVKICGFIKFIADNVRAVSDALCSSDVRVLP